jgi:hypothetical protein
MWRTQRAYHFFFIPTHFLYLPRIKTRQTSPFINIPISTKRSLKDFSILILYCETTSGFSLVPGMLFQPGQERTYLQFAKELSEDIHLFSSGLDSNNLQVVSAIDLKLKKNLEARYSEVTLYHGSCSFLSYLFKERFNLIGQEILVNYFKSHIYIAAFTDQDLSVFNIFELQTKDDVLKYVLIVMNQMKFDRNHVRVTLFGATEKSGITEEWGKDYFQNFRLANPHANQNYTQGFKQLKAENVFEAYWQFE